MRMVVEMTLGRCKGRLRHFMFRSRNAESGFYLKGFFAVCATHNWIEVHRPEPSEGLALGSGSQDTDNAPAVASGLPTDNQLSGADNQAKWRQDAFVLCLHPR